MVFAAIVVLDFFDGVPVTVTQSPLVTELTASVTVLEKAVVVVQLTVVCPEVVLWTSMLDPLREATLPVAPGLAGAEAAPAVEAMAVAARSAVAPVPARRMKRRRVLLRLVSDCIVVIPLSLLCPVMCAWSCARGITRCGGRRWVRAWPPGWPGTPRRGRRWPGR